MMSSSVAQPDPRIGLKVALLFLWFGLVLFLEAHHAFWRDEVKALSIALSGANIREMLENLHGDGHPALWYLLLRGAHDVIGSPIALPVVSVVVAAAAASLLVFRSPFSPVVVGFILLSGLFLVEYSVVARNYGISALLMFLFAYNYLKFRSRGVVLGTILFFLANTNVNAVILVGAFLVYWLVDLISDDGLSARPALKIFCVNAAIAALGVAVCVVTVFPPYNDAVMHQGFTPAMIAKALVLPGTTFRNLLPTTFGPWRILPPPHTFLTQLLISILLFGAIIGLRRSPSALIAAGIALVGISEFFINIYQGDYRHEGLWLIFLVSLYWMEYGREPWLELRMRPGPKGGALRGLLTGGALSVVLLALQVPSGLDAVLQAATNPIPLSRARDFAAFVATRSELRDAIIIADPDFLVEPLPYYMSNQTYLMREERFGNVVHFTKRARQSLQLDEVLATARRLQGETGRPVVILLNRALDPSRPQDYREGYSWTLSTTPAQVNDFLASTEFMGHFGPALSDETFDVYRLVSSHRS